jgi:prepilin-type N-terminal cleavage/methylation domain-containing protein
MRQIRALWANQGGLTLVELIVTVIILGIVLVVVNQVFFSSTRLYGSTSTRANQQMSARAGLSVMANELRTAGCDPSIPPAGIQAILSAAGDTVRVQSDLTGDGAIQTAEPSEDVMYYYDAGQQAVMRDPGTGPEVMIPNVTGCQFTYFDVDNNALVPPLNTADRSRVRSIGINITTETQRGGQMTANTRISLRNG